MNKPRKRLSSEERRQQIVDITLRLIAEGGLQEASMARIAREAGISETAGYRHYSTRRDIILAALDRVTAKLIDNLHSQEDNVIKRLRAVSANLYDNVMADTQESRLFFEFLCAPPREDLRERMQERFHGVILAIESLLQDGVRQGSVLPGTDTTQVAWEIFALGFTLHFVTLLRFESSLTKDKAMHAIEDILTKISA